MPRFALALLIPALLAGGCIHGKLNDRALHPGSVFELIPEDLDLDYETFAVRPDDAVLHAWFFSAGEPGPAVVVMSGNTGNKQMSIPLARELTAAGYHTVLWDYRGFGLSTGEADLWSLVPDAIEVVRAVRARPDVTKVAVLGISLGSAVSLGTAELSSDDVDAIVIDGLLNPARQLEEMVGSFLATLGEWFVVPSGWDLEDNVAELPQPILFIHGTDDGMTPLPPAAELFRRAREAEAPRAFWIADGAGHAPGIAGLYGHEYVRHVTRFLDEALAGRSLAREIDPEWEADGDAILVSVKSVPPVEGAERVPIEVAVIYPEADPEVRRVWLLAGRPARIRFPAAEPLVDVLAGTPAGEIVAESQTWRRTDRYLEDHRTWDAFQDRLYEDLGRGTMLRIPGATVFFRTEDDERTPEQVREACGKLEAQVGKILGDGVHPLIEPVYREAWSALGEAWAGIGENGKAIAAYRRGLDLLSPNGWAWFWYDDASWDLGIPIGLVIRDLEAMAKLAADEEERARYEREAETWKQEIVDRSARIRDWTAAQRAAIGLTDDGE